MSDCAAVVPLATYRLQFRKEFGFDDAAALAPYLARLGVSHVYASPYLKARPGSTHGYDIVDHDRLNPELGDDAAFRRMVSAFRENGLGQVLDFVPNHMGVGGADNPLWLNVLEWGPDLVFAGWFDIDWDPDRRYLHDKLLVPFLGNQYGIELEAGRLGSNSTPKPEASRSGHTTSIKLPICPLHYERILGNAHPALERLGDSVRRSSHLAPADRAPRQRLESRPGRAWRASRTMCARRSRPPSPGSTEREGDFESWQALHALIQDQHWRIAHFRVAADDINYRRFFNINDLAGLRMELPDVFDHAHRLVFRLLRGRNALRSAHRPYRRAVRPQGLSAAAARAAPRRDFYLVVEKILARHESLREDWPVQGTTGYEFAALVLGFLVDPAGEEALTRTYRDFTGNTAPFAHVVRDFEAAHHGARDGERAERARPRCEPGGAAEPAHGRFHPQHPAAGAARGHRLLSGIPHLYRRRGRPDRCRPARSRLGDRAGAAQ